MYCKVITSNITGIQGNTLMVEADVSDGMPIFEMVGYLASEVKEAKERVKAAIRNAGYKIPAKRITINLSPANIRKSGNGFDLPIAIALLGAMGVLQQEKVKDTLIIGELCLSGEILPIRGVLPMILEAKKQGINRVILPKKNQEEAKASEISEYLGATTLQEVIKGLQKKDSFQIYEHFYEIDFGLEDEKREVDFSEIHGQALLKRASEIAVAGKHSLLMIGPPGAGKTMVAERIPTIMPRIQKDEWLEVLKIYSACGMSQEILQAPYKRPFRNPHHTISPTGLAGGGLVPRPGEITLAHGGVLFLDELPEFYKHTLEVLRQPLEKKQIEHIRLTERYSFPADFLMICAMNPCACGYYPNRELCNCKTESIRRYIGKLSEPLLDRIDLCVMAEKIQYEELMETQEEESSETIRNRVDNAQRIQRKRYEGEVFQYNSEIPGKYIKRYCRLSKDQEEYMEKIYNRLNLSARSYHKILKVARTIADLQGMEELEMKHLIEAIGYKSIERDVWVR